MSTPWWRDAVVYQIYPRSFADSNGDGIGDLPGITDKLDYLADLGVDALWLSPIFTSPMRDFGYDVADYCGIDPIFGTDADFDDLIAGCHERGMRLLLDWVPNHSSDQHPWFVESKSSRDNPKRDWYVWKDRQSDGSPSEQLELDVQAGAGVDARRRDRPVVPAPVPRRATRPQLGQPRGRSGHARHAAVLARPRRRRIPGRRRQPDRQGHRRPRPARSVLEVPAPGNRPAVRPRAPAADQDAARQLRPRTDDGGRGVPAARRRECVVRRRSGWAGAAPVVRLPPLALPVGDRADAGRPVEDGGGLRRAALADVRAVEPRSASPSHPLRQRGPRPCGGGSRSHRTRDAVPLRRRGTRAGGWRRSRRPGRRPRRS